MRRVLAPALIAGLAVAAIAGCGGDPEPTTTYESDSPPQGFSGGPPEGAEEFRDCLSEQGVEVPQPQEGGGIPFGPGQGEPSDELREALEACGDLLPGPPGGGPVPEGGYFGGPPG